MRVEQVMTKSVKACNPNDTLNVPAQLMWDHDCGCVPVVNERGETIGILTDRDICMAAYTQGRPLTELVVSNVMSNQVYGCGPVDTLEAAEQIMQNHQIRRLPVLGLEGQLLGILSLNDLALAVAKKGHERSAGMTAGAIETTLAAVCRPRNGHHKIDEVELTV